MNNNKILGLLPKAIISFNRQEYLRSPLQLTVRKGRTKEEATLPTELEGAVFIVNATGSVSSTQVSISNNQEDIVLPTDDGWTSILNGDGQIQRLSFKNGQAEWSTAFVKTPSFYADRLVHQGKDSQNRPFPKLMRFWDFSIARISIMLGNCNQENTAFLPMKFPGQEKERLLSTWDIGRPYEIDPQTLQSIAPVGKNKDWLDMVKLPVARVFRPISTSAHPTFDPKTGELFTVNVTKSLDSLLLVSNLFSYQAKRFLLKLLPQSLLRIILSFIIQVLTKIVVFLTDLFTDFLELFNLGGDDELYLMRWQGEDQVDKWKVVLPNGRNVKIRQTTHQMAVTENHVIVVDTAFKVTIANFIPSIDDYIPDPKDQFKWLEDLEETIEEAVEEKINTRLKFLREYFNYPQLPDSRIYLIDRRQFQDVPSGGTITAKQINLAREFTHFVADYQEEPPNHVSLHVAHNCATDPAEFLHETDTSVFAQNKNDPDDPENIYLRNVVGAGVAPMDVNRPAYYLIDGEKGKIVTQELLDIDLCLKHTWSLGFYAYRDNYPTQKHEDIYWGGFGGWHNMLPNIVFEMYKNYKYRDPKVSHQLIKDRTEKGVPTSINRLHIDRQAASGKVLNIVDHYNFEPGYFASSHQFVPKANTQGATDGYIVCTVVHSDNLLAQNGNSSDPKWSDNSEIWIFDAQNLEQGPIYTLSHPSLNLGLTLHTTWMQNPVTVDSRDYNIEQDFSELLEHNLQGIPEKFRQPMQDLMTQVYQEFNRDRR